MTDGTVSRARLSKRFTLRAVTYNGCRNRDPFGLKKGKRIDQNIGPLVGNEAADKHHILISGAIGNIPKNLVVERIPDRG